MLKIIRITSKSVEDVIKIKFGDLHLMNPTKFPISSSLNWKFNHGFLYCLGKFPTF